MIRTFLISLLLLAFAPQLNAQTIAPDKDTNSLKKKFILAKKEFQLFEKQHGAFVKTNNILMHYLTWGSPSGIPLVWVHGSLTNGYEFLEVANKLASAGYFVIAIDYYGHGQTPIPEHDVSLYHVADDIKVLMDSLHIKKAVIGGFSRGGYISTAFYDAYPGMVYGLILEDGGSVAFNSYNHQLPVADVEKKIQSIGLDALPKNIFDSELDAFCSIYDSSENGTQFELLSWINQTKQGKWSIGTDLMSFFNMADNDQYRDLIYNTTKASLFGESMALIEPKIIFRNLSVPVLILDPISENDVFPFEKENAALQKQHPGFIKHVRYDNTAHNIHFSHPQKFTADLIDFLFIIKKPKRRK